MSKQSIARARNYNKRRISCTQANLQCMLNREANSLTREEQDSIRYIIKVTTKLLNDWPKTVTPR